MSFKWPKRISRGTLKILYDAIIWWLKITAKTFMNQDNNQENISNKEDMNLQKLIALTIYLSK